MNKTKIIWISISLCSFVIGLLPSVWGAGTFSFDGLIFNGLGGLVGVWIGYKITEDF